MNRTLTRPVTEDEIQTYESDGVVCLRGIVDQDWLAFIGDLLEQDKANPSDMVKNINAQGARGDFFGDTFVWQHVDGFRRAIFESPLAEVVAAVTRSAKVNLIFDQILIKEPETTTPTNWHHDATFWPVAGDKIATLWLSLDRADAETGAMEFVAGSHRWGKRFKAVSFDPKESYEEDLPPVPDIEAERDQHRIIRYDLQPGDCTIHHGLLLHAAPGNASKTDRRRAYLTRWGGDDATYNPRPNLQRMLRDPGIPPGGPLDSDLFPVVWRNGLVDA